MSSITMPARASTRAESQSCIISSQPLCSAVRRPCRSRGIGHLHRRSGACHAVTDPSSVPATQSASAQRVDMRALADLMSLQQMEPDERTSVGRIAEALNVPLSAVKGMVYKRKGLLALSKEDIEGKLQQVSSIVGVTYDQARRMAAIQPGLLFDTVKQAETLEYGLKAICYELSAPKEEIVELIINNPSVLHGKEMHLSFSDMAALAMIRQPKGRIID